MPQNDDDDDDVSTCSLDVFFSYVPNPILDGKHIFRSLDFFHLQRLSPGSYFDLC